MLLTARAWAHARMRIYADAQVRLGEQACARKRVGARSAIIMAHGPPESMHNVAHACEARLCMLAQAVARWCRSSRIFVHVRVRVRVGECACILLRVRACMHA